MQPPFLVFLALIVSNTALAEGVNIGNGLTLTNHDGRRMNYFLPDEKAAVNSIVCEGTIDIQLKKAIALTKKTLSKVSSVDYNHISITHQLNQYTPNTTQQHRLYTALAAELQLMFGPHADIKHLSESSIFVSDLANKVFISFVHNCDQ